MQSKTKKQNADRQEEWNGADVHGSRVKLKNRIMELSEVWKKEHAAKQEQKAKDDDKAESSDSDVDIVEDTIQTTKSGSSKKTRATRMRG